MSGNNVQRGTVFRFMTEHGSRGFGVVLANRKQFEMSPSWRVGYISDLYTEEPSIHEQKGYEEVMQRFQPRIRAVHGPLGFRRKDWLPTEVLVQTLCEPPFFLAYLSPDPKWELEILILSKVNMSGIPFARVRKYTGQYFFATCFANSPYIHNRIDAMTTLGLDHDLLYSRYLKENPHPGPLGRRADSLWSNVDLDFETDVEFADYIESEVSG